MTRFANGTKGNTQQTIDLAADPVPPWVQFPTDVLPEPVRGYVTAAAAAIGCDEGLVAPLMLAALAGVVGNTRTIRLKRGWDEPAIVWPVIIGESGSHKSPARDKALRPLFRLQQIERKRFAEVFAKWQAAHDEWEKVHQEWKKAGGEGDEPDEPTQPLMPSLWVDDITTESLATILLQNPRGVCCCPEELSGWFGMLDRYAGGKGGADAARWLVLYGARELRIDRKTGDPAQRTIFVPYAGASLCGTIQPGRLRETLSAEHRDSGLAARFLFSWPPRRPRLWTDAEIDEAAERPIDELFAALYALEMGQTRDGDERPVWVQLTGPAKWLFRRFHDEAGGMLADQTGDVNAMWSKAIGYAARLALLVHLVRAATGESDAAQVDEVSMAAGVQLARWFAHEAARVYAMLGEGDGDRQRRELVEWIDRAGGQTSPRDLQRGFPRRYKSADDALAELKDLAARRLGTLEQRPATGGRGGRPSMIFTRADKTPDGMTIADGNPEKINGNGSIVNCQHPAPDEDCGPDFDPFNEDDHR